LCFKGTCSQGRTLGPFLGQKLDQSGNQGKPWEKNGERGKLGQDRLEVRWEAVMFLFNLGI